MKNANLARAGHSLCSNLLLNFLHIENNYSYNMGNYPIRQVFMNFVIKCKNS